MDIHKALQITRWYFGLEAPSVHREEELWLGARPPSV